MNALLELPYGHLLLVHSPGMKALMEVLEHSSVVTEAGYETNVVTEQERSIALTLNVNFVHAEGIPATVEQPPEGE